MIKFSKIFVMFILVLACTACNQNNKQNIYDDAEEHAQNDVKENMDVSSKAFKFFLCSVSLRAFSSLRTFMSYFN